MKKDTLSNCGFPLVEVCINVSPSLLLTVNYKAHTLGLSNMKLIALIPFDLLTDKLKMIDEYWSQ